ncbi:MAG: CDP-glycerol glycerophosphotransferase family protein [Lachnospiraceae bacterium]|nr:CDP-glycerol glycerophosphotransferase family protein [Lachnospiraceae bacterium]
MRVIKKLLKAPFELLKKLIVTIQYIVSLIYIYQNKKKLKKKNKRLEKLNVVFIVQYIPGWNKLEPIYFKMKLDDRFNPIIVCVPLNIKNSKLLNQDFSNDTYDYFISKGCEAINALDENGEWFDIRNLSPDFVFHSRPYNSCMPQCFSSKEIRKYALLCNVLYGPNMTKNVREETLNFDYFSDVFCYFAFDDDEKDFYIHRFFVGTKCGIQKCYPYGATALEQMLLCKKEREESSYVKTVFWTPRWSTDPNTGGSNFFRYVNTIKELVRLNPNVLFIIRPHPLMFENFVNTGEMSKKGVYLFKKYCETTNNVCLDESKEYLNNFWQSDILITDMSGIVPEYFITGKPIIYCHSTCNFIYDNSTSRMIDTLYAVNSSEELVNEFNHLICNEDEKRWRREECIKNLFGDYKNNSENILGIMKDIR